MNCGENQPRTIGNKIAIEAWVPAPSPVIIVVRLGPYACSCGADKRVLFRIYYESGMARPYDHVSGLRVSHAMELWDPSEDLVRSCVWIVQPPGRKHLMNQMRAIQPAIRHVLLQCQIDQRSTLRRAE